MFLKYYKLMLNTVDHVGLKQWYEMQGPMSYFYILLYI